MKKYGFIIQLFLILTVYLPCGQTTYSQPRSIIAPMPFSYEEHWLFLEPGDTINGAWNHISALEMPLFGTSAYYIESINKVFICGGIDSLDNPKKACYYYNIQTNSYEVRDSLPTGRAYGKLVKVKDSLYLVGAVSNFNIPDGVLYKYNPSADQWQIKSPVPGPFVHEMAVCVWNDSLVIAVGGSTSGFGGAVNTVRVYDPATDTWRVLGGATNVFPVNISASQAECIGSNIVLVGGLNSSQPYNKVFRGYIPSDTIDNIYWLEDTTTTPFGTGVYRIGGGKFGSFMVFGPALSASVCLNQLWGFNIYDSTWTRFLPNTTDIASRTSLAVKHTADSLYYYLFGGITRDTAGIHFINTCEKYSTGNPVIGIAGNNNQLPEGFILYQNYPNPFNPSTAIEFYIPKRSFVSLKIYDIIGREVSIVAGEYKSAGKHSLKFDASKLSSGIYFYTIIAGDFKETKKMVLVK